MNKNTETAIALISAFFVLLTAMIDPQASFVVAVVALICFALFKFFFANEMANKSGQKPTKISKPKSVKKSKSAKKIRK